MAQGAISSFTMPIMACMARPAAAVSASPSISISGCGTTCQDRP
ncbi:hypothetical protein ACFQU7_18250 [Pseudoroseomonas wenyumeiae]